MNQGYVQGRSQTIYLPPGGYLAAPQFVGMGPYGGHDPMLSRAAGNPYTMGAAGSLGVGSPGAGGTGIWSPGGSPGAVAAGFQNAQARANAANEDRYGQILGGYDSIEKEQKSITDNMYSMADQDIEEEYNNLASKMVNQFTKNGFGPNQSTVANALLQSNARQKLRAKADLYDRMAQARMSPLNTRRDKLSFMERRNDRGPDMGQLAALMTQAGEAAGGGGGLNQGAGQLGNGAVAMVPGGGYGYIPPGRRRVGTGNDMNLSLGQLRNLQRTDPGAYNSYRQTGQMPAQNQPSLVGGAINGLAKLFGLT